MNKNSGSKSSGGEGRKPPVHTSPAVRRSWARNLETILTELNISDWNYLLIGDGSGNTWDYGCAFAALMIENGTDWRDVFFGGFNCGTNQYAELNAYCNPLDWLYSRDDPQRSASGACNIHILSDSEWVADTGAGRNVRKAHLPTWAKYEAYRRRAFHLHWHWIPGHVGIPANEFCDSVAGAVNKLLKSYSYEDALREVQRPSIDRLYPARQRA